VLHFVGLTKVNGDASYIQDVLDLIHAGCRIW
jgi:hypothetical protein